MNHVLITLLLITLLAACGGGGDDPVLAEPTPVPVVTNWGAGTTAGSRMREIGTLSLAVQATRPAVLTGRLDVDKLTGAGCAARLSVTVAGRKAQVVAGQELQFAAAAGAVVAFTGEVVAPSDTTCRWEGSKLTYTLAKA